MKSNLNGLRSSMHILFLTDNFPPEGNAPATRTYEHAREWVKLGHKVTVITGAPNFPEGKVFDGYKNNWYSKSDLDGIEVRRVKTYITANEGFIKRILDFISFMFTSFIAGLFVKKPDRGCTWEQIYIFVAMFQRASDVLLLSLRILAYRLHAT